MDLARLGHHKEVHGTDAELGREAGQGAEGQVLLPDLHPPDVDPGHTEDLGELIVRRSETGPKFRDPSADVADDGVCILGLHGRHRRGVSSSHILAHGLLISRGGRMVSNRRSGFVAVASPQLAPTTPPSR